MLIELFERLATNTASVEDWAAFEVEKCLRVVFDAVNLSQGNIFYFNTSRDIYHSGQVAFFPLVSPLIAVHNADAGFGNMPKFSAGAISDIIQCRGTMDEICKNELAKLENGDESIQPNYTRLASELKSCEQYEELVESMCAKIIAFTRQPHIPLTHDEWFGGVSIAHIRTLLHKFLFSEYYLRNRVQKFHTKSL